MEEAQLIELARNGDRDAFAQLLQRYEKPVYHQALRMVGSAEDAADMTQDAFIKAWQGLPNFQGGSSFSTWLYRITGNVCIDFLRREKKRRGEPSLDDEDSGLAAQLADPAPSPQRALEREELRQAVSAALSRLSDDHRQVLVLREVSGLSYEEIGQALDLSPGTVKSRLARARLSLANFLRKSGNISDYLPSISTDGSKGGDRT